MQVQQQTDARSLFKAAYENRYTWDENFPGYTADVTLKQGGETYTAKVHINRDLTYEFTDLSDEKGRELLQHHLWETVTHRKRSNFEQAHGKNTFTLGDTDETGSTEIQVSGDAMGSHYRIRNNEISQVNRTMPQVAFSINHKGSFDTGSGYISARYDVVYRNPKTDDLVGENDVDSEYEKFGDYYLLTRQVTRSNQQGQQDTQEVTFSNIQLS
ncbi:MAG: DUF3386 domain-containing protein [Leptolyngbyaceae cyanobacterium SM1_3_5]|nr:DUF3386 domain-containing protein [Leptolyngbyaceae cyanobacterium SM1_3_5]